MEEGLLVLKKWMSASEVVMVSIATGSAVELGSLTIGSIRGSITSIDEKDGFFVVSSARKPLPIGESFFMIHLKDWIFGYSEVGAMEPPFDRFAGDGRKFSEVITMTRENVALIQLATFLPEA